MEVRAHHSAVLSSYELPRPTGPLCSGGAQTLGLSDAMVLMKDKASCAGLHYLMASLEGGYNFSDFNSLTSHTLNTGCLLLTWSNLTVTHNMIWMLGCWSALATYLFVRVFHVVIWKVTWFASDQLITRCNHDNADLNGCCSSMFNHKCIL